MTTLRSQAATIAQRLSGDKDVTEADIVELARIVAKANPKDVPAWADANPRGFAAHGNTEWRLVPAWAARHAKPYGGLPEPDSGPRE